MNLLVKKKLASRTLNVGSNRIKFNKERLSDIKDAITKQDIRDLLADKAIIIKEKKGTKKIVKRKTRRRQGSKKKNVLNKKRKYMTITRKLRAYLAKMKRTGQLKREEIEKLRKEIRASSFSSLAQLKQRISGGI